MRNIFLLLKGYALVSVVCAFPERFLNFCAQNSIAIWNVERVDGVTLRLCLRDVKAAKAFAGDSLTVVRHIGVPTFVRRFRKRYALFAGLLITIVGLFALSQFVWEINLVGAEAVDSEVILRELDALGVKIGSPKRGINSAHLQNLLILKVPQIEWLAVNVRGSVATVEVRERVMKPEIVAQDVPCNVVAAKSGLIVKMDTLAGAAQRVVGQTVEAGELLVSGLLNSDAIGFREVHAMADVTLRTWYENRAALPENFGGKRYTGRTITRRAIIIAGKRINFYKNASQTYANCDKLEQRTTLRVPPNLTLPVTFVTETFTEFETSEYKIAEPSADAYLRGVLGLRLDAQSEGGEIIAAEFKTTRGDGVWLCEVAAECLESGAVSVPLVDS
ncbi:hypothetical protein FACS1894217_00750 [Clostridia bacterium]|nr:hypothetical protein FACS1894217_00750 [Clostridia bacterium]